MCPVTKTKLIWRFGKNLNFRNDSMESVESSKATLTSIGKLSKRLKHPLLELDSSVKEFVLGRNREAQCMILDVAVSRRHASLKYLTGQGWTITDNKV